MIDRQEAKDLVQRVQDGDVASLERLYDAFTPLLFSVARRIAGSRAGAEEAIRETWVEAYRRVSEYDPLERVTLWLLGILRSKALEHRGGPGPEAERDPDPQADPEEVRRWQTASAALDGLGGSRRAVLEMAYFDGLTPSAIAKRLQKPVAEVKESMRSGLEHLRGGVPAGAVA